MQVEQSVNGGEPAECKSVLMVGTSLTTMGGVSAMVRGYAAAGLFDRFPIRYVVTHRDGSALDKLAAAATGWLAVAASLWRMERPLVHIHLSFRASFWRKLVVCYLARAFRRPYVLHLHSGGFLDFYLNECGSLKKRLVRNAFDRAASVLALSEEWKVRLERVFPGAPMAVLPNAVSLPAEASCVRMREQVPRIVSLGRLGANKGTSELIEAFARLGPVYPDARLICAGDGSVEPYAQRAAELGVADRVEFPGWLDREQCEGQLRAASIFALPSHSEGLPMALLEAMSWGLPVVTTPVGGIPQVVQHGANGMLVEPGDVDGLSDALNSLLGDFDQRCELGRLARETIEEKYSIRKHVDDLFCVYRSFGVPV